MEPQPRIGLATLTQVAFDGGELNALRLELIAQHLNNPAHAGSLMDLSVIDQLLGRQAPGLEWQSKALEICRAFWTFRHKRAQKTILIYAAPNHMGGNTPVEFLLPQDEFNIVTYYIDPSASGGDADALPHHDVAFCAIPADGEDARSQFETVRKLSADTKVETLNLPPSLVKPERDTLPDLLVDAKGLRIPKTLRLGAGTLLKTIETGTEAAVFNAVGGYPYVVRPVGSHAGFGLSKIETPDAFIDYLAERQEQQFFVGEFINYASAYDGNFRKYRIVLVDGKALPCHMAISDQWNVWYMNSQMQETAAKRQEEATFMDQFAADFAKRHQHAFKALQAGMGLEYFGLDCAEDAQGNLVVFEVDNALIVHDMDCKAVFPYKAKHMQHIFRAFEEMVQKRCAPRELEDSVPVSHSAELV